VPTPRREVILILAFYTCLSCLDKTVTATRCYRLLWAFAFDDFLDVSVLSDEIIEWQQGKS
jgi:hypothetical protein